MTKSKIKKPKFKAEYGTAKWEAAANEVVRCYAPEIYPCRHCSAPVAKGYCCGYCGSNDPINPDFE